MPPAPIISREEVPVPTPGIIADEASKLPTGVWLGETSKAIACSTTSRRITLQITPDDGSGPAQATIVFGDNDRVPPVEDPDQSYPPGISEEEAHCRSNNPTPGFAYAVRDGRMSSSGRFDFRVAVAEPYIPWCALQTSTHAGDGVAGYLCIPELDTEQSFDCYSAQDRSNCIVPEGKLRLCRHGGICLCFQDGCTTDLNRFNRFDLELTSPTEMAGVVAEVLDAFDEPVELRLRKVE
jgi:hypothetical protein